MAANLIWRPFREALFLPAFANATAGKLAQIEDIKEYHGRCYTRPPMGR